MTLAQSQSSQMPTRFQFSLAAELFASRWVFEHHFPSHVLLYCPDRSGMPILVAPHIYELYTEFRGGAQVGRVIAAFMQRDQKARFADLLLVINSLFERGMLRENPDEDRFTPSSETLRRKSYRNMIVWLHVNNNCNLACSYCFVDHTRVRMEGEVLLRTAALIADTAKQHGVEEILLKFAGGEPTLSLEQMEQFHEVLSELIEGTGIRLAWGILTNGTNVSDRFIAFVKKARASVAISLDGYGSYHDIHRVYRTAAETSDAAPKGSWEKIQTNIQRLREEGIKPYINGTISRESRDGLAPLAEWMYREGMTGTIHVVRNLGSSWETANDRRAEYEKYCIEMAEAFEAMFTSLESREFTLELPHALDVCELYFEEPAEDICCGIGANHLVIKHDGSLASCPMTVHEPTVIPTEDLFKSAKQTFSASPEDRGDDGACLRCQWFKVCASACPVNNERLNGHPFTRSPLCHFWKYVIPRYLVFYGRKVLQAENGIGELVHSTSSDQENALAATC